jgi:hypothetical protein
VKTVGLLYVKQSADFSAASKSLRSSMYSHELRQIALKNLRQIILKTTPQVEHRKQRDVPPPELREVLDPAKQVG